MSVNKVSIGSNNGLSPVQHQAITQTNAGILLIGPLGTNSSEIRIGNLSFSFKKMHLKLLSAKMAAILSRGRWVNIDLMFVSHIFVVCNYAFMLQIQWFTHWDRVTHICVDNITIIGSDNGLSPGRRQAIIWTNAAILLIRPLGTNFSEILIGNQTFSFKKIHLKMSSAKWRPFCLGLNVLRWGNNEQLHKTILCAYVYVLK